MLNYFNYMKEQLQQWWLEHGNQITKRSKSFAWRAGCVGAIAAFNWMGQNIGMFELSPVVQGFIGLVLAEITKWLNDHTNLFGVKNK